MYYTKLESECQGLLFGNSEDAILTGLAHARDGVFLLREGITERGSLTLAGDAGCLSDSTHTGNARELGCQGVSLENVRNLGGKRAETSDQATNSHQDGSDEIIECHDEADEDDVFHVYIVPEGRGFVKR